VVDVKRETIRQTWLLILWTSMLAPLAVAAISFGSIVVWERYWSNSPLERTGIRLLSVYDLASFNVVDHDRGNCFSDSQVNPAVFEAHRCFGTRNRIGKVDGELVRRINYIYDPCWNSYDADGPRLLCIDSPWTREAVSFRVGRWMTFTKSGDIKYSHYPQSDARASIRQTRPWAMELDNGMRCVLAGGMTYSVAGMRANYQCAMTDHPRDGTIEGWVIGDPNRTLPVWIVSFIRSGDASAAERGVRVAWY
jgi:hypothetical protein